jgi:hypothetical protein
MAAPERHRGAKLMDRNHDVFLQAPFYRASLIAPACYQKAAPSGATDQEN